MLRHRTHLSGAGQRSFRKRDDVYCWSQTTSTFWSSATEYSSTSSSSFENRSVLGLLSAAKRFSQLDRRRRCPQLSQRLRLLRSNGRTRHTEGMEWREMPCVLPRPLRLCTPNELLTRDLLLRDRRATTCVTRGLPIGYEVVRGGKTLKEGLRTGNNTSPPYLLTC
jgi:hypothetical protein